MNDFEQKMASLADGLSADAKALAGQVLDLELRNRFGERSQLPEELAARALKAVKARPEDGAPT
jgi:hypothetical protein